MCPNSKQVVRDLTESGTDAFRAAVLPGGFVLDWYAGVLLVTTTGSASREDMLAVLERWSSQSGLEAAAVYHKVAVNNPSSMDVPRLIAGTPPAFPHEVRENGMRFLVDFESGYSTGLFCDQRTNRARVRAEAKGNLLNLFAYTGSFSVAGALAGASTCSVDLSKKALARARDNFAANGIDPSGHRFIAEDVFAFLPRLARRGGRFDWIILDPPTFSRGKAGKIFQIARQIDGLLDAVFAVAAHPAWILVSTNCGSLDAGALATAARGAAARAGLRAACDPFQTPPDFSNSAHAEGVWVRLESERR